MTSIMFKRCVFLWRYVPIEEAFEGERKSHLWKLAFNESDSRQLICGQTFPLLSLQLRVYKKPHQPAFSKLRHLRCVAQQACKVSARNPCREARKTLRNSRQPYSQLPNPVWTFQRLTSHHMLWIVERMFQTRWQPSTSLCHSCESQLFNLNFWSNSTYNRTNKNAY